MGATKVSDAKVTVKQVPELMPEVVARKTGVKLDQAATIASGDSSREVSDKERALARFQGNHGAQIAAKLAA